MKKKRINYQDYSSGRVLYGMSGATNFSVRISNEIFEWCDKYFTSKGKTAPYIIYDPFCGIAYSLTELGFLHGSKIKYIVGSDIDEKSLEFAKKNLSLLTYKGIDNRIEELQKFINQYNRESHKEALDSAKRLKAIINPNINIEIFQFNILNNMIFSKDVIDIDLVITDVPYGELTKWQGIEKDSKNPIQIFLDKLKTILSKDSLVVIVLNKKQIISYAGYNKIKILNRGTRKIIILETIF